MITVPWYVTWGIFLLTGFVSFWVGWAKGWDAANDFTRRKRRDELERIARKE